MRLWNPFKRRANGIVHEPAGERVGKPIDGTSLRRGMWVMYNRNVIGIVVGLNKATNLVEVMTVDPLTGDNRALIAAGQGDLEQARYADIPPARSLNLTAEQAAALGYR